MSELEDRLRAELPDLADALTDTESPPGSGVPGAVRVSTADLAPPSTHTERRRLLGVAAATVLIAAAVGIGFLVASSDSPQPLATDALGDDPSVTQATANEPETTRRVDAVEFGISLQIPATWDAESAGTDSLSWSGEGGWVSVSAAADADGMIGVVGNNVNHRLRPFGTSPDVEPVVIDGADARKISPSPDAPQTRGFLEAALIIQSPATIPVSGGAFDVLTVYADVDHVDAIAASIRFLTDHETGEVAAERDVTTLGSSPDGRFTYRASYPAGGEFNGVLLVDDGETTNAALRDPRDEFDRIGAMRFGPDGLIAWQSIDENYGILQFIGRIGDDGRIVDSHQIGVGAELSEPGEFDDQGGFTMSTRNGPPHYVDLANDPFFTMSNAPVPVIESTTPLAPALVERGRWAGESGSWYLGETLGTAPACGASTLYKDDADGYARVLDASIELDTVADVDVTGTEAAVGFDVVGAARVVVVSTECPGEYEGRQIHWGIESVDYGDGGPRFERPLDVASIEIGPVAEVESVEPTYAGSDACCRWLSGAVLTVTLLDGTRQEVTVSTTDPTDVSAPATSDALSVPVLLDTRPRGPVTLTGAAVDTGGGWVICERADDSWYLGCGGRSVVVTNFDPRVDERGPGSWEGSLIDDARFALSIRDPQTDGTEEQLAIARALAGISISGTSVDTGTLPFAPTVRIGLGSALIEERTPQQLSDTAGWSLELPSFRGAEGTFSILETLDRASTTDVTVGPHSHCASPPARVSDQIVATTQLSIQPTEIDSCLLWFAVDIFLDDRDRIVAITLDFWEP